MSLSRTFSTCVCDERRLWLNDAKHILHLAINNKTPQVTWLSGKSLWVLLQPWHWTDLIPISNQLPLWRWAASVRDLSELSQCTPFRASDLLRWFWARCKLLHYITLQSNDNSTWMSFSFVLLLLFNYILHSSGSSYRMPQMRNERRHRPMPVIIKPQNVKLRLRQSHLICKT